MKSFLRPDRKKLLLFLLLFFLVPYPLFFLHLPSGGVSSLMRLRYFWPPFLFLEATGEIIDVVKEGGLPLWTSVTGFIEIVIVPLIYPLFLYFGSCWIISLVEKKRKSQNLLE